MKRAIARRVNYVLKPRLTNKRKPVKPWNHESLGKIYAQYGGKRKKKKRTIKRKGGSRALLKEAHGIIKSHRFISRGLNHLSSKGVPLTGTLAKVASHFGYGRKRRRPIGGRRRKYGGSLWDDIGNGLNNANNWLKNNKVISTFGRPLANLLPPPYSAIANPLIDLAAKNGYGRRRRRTGRGVSKRAGGFRYFGKGGSALTYIRTI